MAETTRQQNGWSDRIRSIVDTPMGRAQREADRLDRFIEGRIEDVLNRINIPSRSDIERLNASVELLTAKVDALLSRQAARELRSQPPTRRGN